MSLTYDRLKEAMLAGRPVSLVYRGHRRDVCCHVIGLAKSGIEQVLTYQYGGGSSSGLPPGGEWRCMMVGNIHDVQIIDDPWRTGDDHNRTQTCVSQVDVELWVGDDGKPYVKRA